MPADRNFLTFDFRAVEIPKKCTAVRGHRHVQHLIEIAIVEAAVPIHANKVAAHQTFHRAGIEIVFQKLLVARELLRAL